MNDRLAIGIDLGGTYIKGVLLNGDNGDIVRQMTQPTGDKPADGKALKIWKKAVRQMVRDFNEEGGPGLPVGISAPGLPDASRQFIAYMPGRLAGLENLNWAEHLEVERVSVINDAKAALVAELHFGTGKNYKNIIMLTLGTGVGGALLIDGRLYTGLFNRAGHFGHMSLQTDAPAGIVNLPGTLENFIGNATIKQRSFGKYDSTKALVEAYQTGEPLAALVWLESLKKLAVGLCSLINALAPELIILGGGITNANDAFFQPLMTFMDLYEWRPGGIQTPVKKAAFGSLAGAVGAACFVLSEN